ncbi:MAG: putative manganese-dependent inorganic diphosphatase [Lentisphaeria bacterium]|nr:putative manganese-dependent inorganic diphosphatase [Lentisphaeria bacterium]
MESKGKIFVTGHRNPDIDSLASAFALAELRRRQGASDICALCPGVMPERARFLFEKFRLPLPVSRNDIHLRVSDIMDRSIPTIPLGVTLLDAVRTLKESGYPRLPVIRENGEYAGMLSPLNLLSHLLDISEGGLTGRMIYSSIRMMSEVIEAELLAAFDVDEMQNFKVYVAAMGVDSFETHMPQGESRELAIITGDRAEIHLHALQLGIRLMIVTGDKEIEPLILESAKLRGVTVLRTKLDSASVIRRLKFSMPVEYFGFSEKTVTVLKPSDRVRRVENPVLNQPEDVIPVVDEKGFYAGVVFKKSVTGEPPFRMILVDHNEVEQSLPGVEEIPVIEVVDHHRIGMMPTAVPIKFTGDIVGSTCTLVASMFKSSGESLTPELAGLLLGGIVSDTLDLKSPTAAALDQRMYEWLEKISGVKGTELMAELSRIDSPLASKTPDEVIDSDRKTYVDGKYKFSLSQVEESNLELLHQRLDELRAAMQSVLENENLSFIALMVTDAVRENSEMLVFGDKHVMANLPYRHITDELFAMPGILSRKKQLLPQILSVTSALNRGF